MFNMNPVIKMCSLSLLCASTYLSAAITQQSTAKNVYQVKQLLIGQLPVKIIVPISAKTTADALRQAHDIAKNKDIDMVELRIDMLDYAKDSQQVIALGKALAAILKEKPLLVTIRTRSEGGQIDISDQEYQRMYSAYLQQPFMQLLDIEMFHNPDVVKHLTELAHQQQVLVVMSSHDFKRTPSEEDIVQRLLQQDHMGADILKIAVMPESKQDVMTLMQATFKVSQQSKKPLLTMSMGQLGVISRIATANIGGSMSFARLDKASAPGQLHVAQLKELLQTVQPAF